MRNMLYNDACITMRKMSFCHFSIRKKKFTAIKVTNNLEFGSATNISIVPV